MTWLVRNALWLIMPLCLGCGPTIDAGDASEDDGDGSTGLPTMEDATTRPDPVDPATTDAVEPDFDGSYLLAVSPSLSPATPLQYLAVVRIEDGRLFLELQPLTLDVGSTTTPREPHGDPIVTPSVDLGPDASFSFVLRELFVPGPTNPITGSDIVANVEFGGTFVDRRLICGRVSGEILSPLSADLAGSTFAATALDGGGLPVEFPMACP